MSTYKTVDGTWTINDDGSFNLIDKNNVMILHGDATGGFVLDNATLFAQLKDLSLLSDPSIATGNGKDVVIALSDAGVTMLGGNGQDLLIGGAGADTLYGGNGNDILVGREGNDILNGGNGSDILIGSGGSDTAAYLDANAAVTVTLTDSTDSQGNFLGSSSKGSAGNDILIGIENIRGSDYSDTLIGNSLNNILEGGKGNDIIDGGAGIDTASYEHASGSVTVDLTTGTSSGADGVDTLTNIENIKGSAFDDTLIGSSGDNVIDGDTGADTLDGLAGADTLRGGTGDDTYIVDNAADVVIENTGEGTDTILSSGTYTLSSNVEILALTGTTSINGTGNSLNNMITGNIGNNILIGDVESYALVFASIDTPITQSVTLTYSHDTLNGSGGNDILVGDVNSFSIRLTAGNASATLQNSAYTFGNDTLTTLSYGASLLIGDVRDLTLELSVTGSTTAANSDNAQITASSFTFGNDVLTASNNDNNVLIGDVQNYAINLVGGDGTTSTSNSGNAIIGGLVPVTLTDGNTSMTFGADILASDGSGNNLLVGDTQNFSMSFSGGSNSGNSTSFYTSIAALHLNAITFGNDSLTSSGNGNNIIVGDIQNLAVNIVAGDYNYGGLIGSAGIISSAVTLGNDTLQATGTGNNILIGDIENYTMNFTAGNYSNGTVDGAATGSAWYNLTTVKFGNDTLSGSAGNHWLYGDIKNWQVTLEAGDFTVGIYAGHSIVRSTLQPFGNDTLLAGTGIAHLFGDVGNATWNMIGGSSSSAQSAVSNAGGFLSSGTSAVSPVSFGNDLLDGSLAMQAWLYGDAQTLTFTATAGSNTGSGGQAGYLGNTPETLPFGNNTLIGSTGNDYLYGNLKDLYFQFTGGSNNPNSTLATINSRAGFVTNGSPTPLVIGSDILQGGAGNDQLWGDMQAATWSFTGGNILILPTTVTTFVDVRGTIANTALISFGNDNLQGGSDNDILYGDLQHINWTFTDGTVTLADGSVHVGNVGNRFAGAEINSPVTFGTNTLYGDSGNDILVGGILPTNIQITRNGTLLTNSGAVALTNGEDIATLISSGDLAKIFSSNGNALLTTNGVLAPTAPAIFWGNNTMDGGSGADILYGGPGNNTLSYSDSDAGVYVNLQTNNIHDLGANGDVGSTAEFGANVYLNGVLQGKMTVDASADTILDIEHFHSLMGSAHNDVLIARNGDTSTLKGGAGADQLTGGAGGFTVASYQDSLSGLVINLSNTALSTGDAAGDQYTNIQSIIATTFDDTLIANSATNRLDGSAGIDTVSYQSSAAGVTINFANPALSSGDTAGDTFVNVEKLVGSTHNDTFIIASGASLYSLEGGNGSDTLNFASTAVSLTQGLTLNYDASGNPLFALANQWKDLQAHSTFSFNFSTNLLINSPDPSALPGINAAYHFTGTGGATLSSLESLTGNPSDASASFEMWFKPSLLTGGKQVLFETGGSGTGTALYIDGNDILFTSRQGANIKTVSFADGLTTASEFTQMVGVIDFAGDTVQLYVNGIAISSTLTTASDWAGGDGSGLARISNTAAESGLVNYSGDIAILRFYERPLTANEVATNYTAVAGVTPTGAPVVLTVDLQNGTSTSNINIGGTAQFAQMENVIGSSFQDILISNASDNTLTGGLSSDTFVFKAGNGNDVITDYQANIEMIDISDYNIALADLASHINNDASGNAVVTLDSSANTITLLGVDTSDVVHTNFIL